MAATEERRAAQRLPAFLGGLILFPDGHRTAECIIRNRSAGGARLIVHDARYVPDTFDLVIPQRNNERVQARARWRGRDELGVTITAQPDGDDAENTALVERLQRENRRLKRRLQERAPKAI